MYFAGMGWIMVIALLTQASHLQTPHTLGPPTLKEGDANSPPLLDASANSKRGRRGPSSGPGHVGMQVDSAPQVNSAKDQRSLPSSEAGGGGRKRSKHSTSAEGGNESSSSRGHGHSHGHSKSSSKHGKDRNRERGDKKGRSGSDQWCSQFFADAGGSSGTEMTDNVNLIPFTSLAELALQA